LAIWKGPLGIFIASLAFLLDRALEKKLKSAGLDLSSKKAWQTLRTVRVVDIDLGNGERKQSVTHGSSRAATSHPSRITKRYFARLCTASASVL
jgi:hypothetical protein